MRVGLPAVVAMVTAVSWTSFACGHSSQTATASPTGASEPEDPDGSSEPSDQGFGPFTASLDADHPLVGTAWSVEQGRALARVEVERAIADATIVLLGETHDHPDHHRLQGAMISSLIAAGHSPAVAYEMLDPGDQAAIDAYPVGPDADVDGFAELVGWAESGWPAWGLYRPAFAPVLQAGLPILAAQVPRSETKQFMTEGMAMVAPETVARYGLDRPLPDATQAAWLDEMFASHCEMVAREHLTPMVEIQRIRDARMSDALLDGVARNQRAVLVAGTGHTRAAGVPRLLAMTSIDPTEVVSVGFVSVDSEHLAPGDYGQDFDVIVFTPGVEREDPCESLREQQ